MSTEQTYKKYDTRQDRLQTLKSFIQHESFSGVLLFLATILAVIIANSPFSDLYHTVWNMPLGVSLGGSIIDMKLSLWINDAFMTFFFLMVGLEIKREMAIGELSSLSKASFPIVAAIGGMIIPAVIYVSFNPENPSGFGVPMATDIAFALAILMVLGKRVNIIFKLVLIALAIADDLGAILIVALVYTNELNVIYLIHIVVVYGLIWILNYKNVNVFWPYLVLGVFLWVYIHSLGVHATISGVLLAFAIPIKSKIDEKKFIMESKELLKSFERHMDTVPVLNHHQIDDLEALEQNYDKVQNPLVRLEHSLGYFSTYFIMPLFAFSNAGIAIYFDSVSSNLSIFLGVLLGLLIGKPLGVFGFSYLCTKLNIVKKPDDISWSDMIAMGFLAGIGFTMSIFITNLAFTDPDIINAVKLAVFISSILAAIIGALLIIIISNAKKKTVLSRAQRKNEA